ncbi:uncharacterized protein LOC101740664 [Bombyx mori]|uniref:Chorion class A n=1 Tax=Bombyx mori TaxID=7091 RepID=H9JJD2_BOMMO|nr:uncharacterized protein LOC101740664 [Bombyx mori]BAS21461.1 chorion class A [Bombyx mori]
MESGGVLAVILVLIQGILSLPMSGNGCLGSNLYSPYGSSLYIPTVATGNGQATVTSLPNCFSPATGFPDYGPVRTNQVTPLVTEIVPSLQFGDISVTGDMPIGGTIKVSGCFPVYGTVAVDGNMPSSGKAVINTGGGFVTQYIDPSCGCGRL